MVKKHYVKEEESENNQVAEKKRERERVWGGGKTIVTLVEGDKLIRKANESKVGTTLNS